MQDKRQYLFDNPRNVKLVIYTLYISCGLLLLLDFIVHRHILHQWEQLLGFYPIYGFVGCTAIVIGSKVLRVFVQRNEDFYDRNATTDTHGENDVVK